MVVSYSPMVILIWRLPIIGNLDMKIDRCKFIYQYLLCGQFFIPSTIINIDKSRDISSKSLLASVEFKLGKTYVWLETGS